MNKDNSTKSASWRPVAAAVAIGLAAGGIFLAIALPQANHNAAPVPVAMPVSAPVPLASAASMVAPVAATPVRFADFGSETVSADARHLADWIADARDNANTAFIIVDKKNARALVFDADARLRGATPILLGAAIGDHSAPGIGTRPLSKVKPDEKTTPAGRFLAERGKNIAGEDIIWVDYDAAVSMHRVRATVARERRLERLASETVRDNRISFGCINVPKNFYESFVRPVFATQRALVYVLPEIKPVQEVFGSYDVASRHRPKVAQ